MLAGGFEGRIRIDSGQCKIRVIRLMARPTYCEGCIRMIHCIETIHIASLPASRPHPHPHIHNSTGPRAATRAATNQGANAPSPFTLPSPRTRPSHCSLVALSLITTSSLVVVRRVRQLVPSSPVRRSSPGAPVAGVRSLGPTARWEWRLAKGLTPHPLIASPFAPPRRTPHHALPILVVVRYTRRSPHRSPSPRRRLFFLP